MNTAPTDFGDAKAEYQSALTSAALFDVSSAGKLEVTGPEAPDYLHNLCTNDVKSLAVGAGCEAFFCNVKAKALFHTRIYHVKSAGHDALWIDVTPGANEALLKHLDRHLIAERVELADRTQEFAQLHLAGPTAVEVLTAALGQAIPDLDLYQHMERTIGSATVQIRRNDPLGVPGYDIVCPLDETAMVRDRLLAAGAMQAGATAWEWLRVEAGTPVYGCDIDENRFVVEVGRTHAISYTKGCYLGQEPIVMARDRAGFVNRSLRGLRFPDANVSVGAKLFAKDEVGIVTSVANSPNLGAIGLGYLKRGSETPGTTVHVASPEGPAATVANLTLRDRAE